MGKIIFSSLAQNKLLHLFDVLLEKEYFSFQDSAADYVNNIEKFVFSIASQQHCPINIKEYGSLCIKYKANKRTTWYITFDKENDVYLIKNIINNHTPDYPAFLRELK